MLGQVAGIATLPRGVGPRAPLPASGGLLGTKGHIYFSDAGRVRQRGLISRLLRPAVPLASGLDHCRRPCSGACARVVRLPSLCRVSSETVRGMRSAGRLDRKRVPGSWGDPGVMRANRPFPGVLRGHYGPRHALMGLRRPAGCACTSSAR